MTENYKDIKAGHVLIHQGDVLSRSAYIIEKGRVEIRVRKTDGEIQVVGSRGPGSLIGEMSLIDDAARSASVIALEDCSLLEITQDDFQHRLSSSDPVMQAILGVLITRYRDTLSRSVIISDTPGYPNPEVLELHYLEKANTLKDLKLENEFRDAMSNGQLSLHYQPIVDLVSADIIGFEALMRWIHPEKGFISPAVFIPMAERSGLIIDASQWALRDACAFIKTVNALDPSRPPKYVSVNFSSKDIAEDTFLQSILSTLKEFDVSPAHIQLEITESLLMTQPEKAKVTLNACRDAGLRIAIDDFGTGYSSLSYLHNYPITALKIDQAFIRDMLKNPSSLELCRSIVTLGKNLNMSTIAEGIEGLAEANALIEIGCDSCQGYYFSRPVPEAAILDLLAQSHDFKAKMG
ncbi:MAG: EAL domain-containing protein [Alphaproteobacteria bacterium]|jgi:EAL domain-containing protein (putative c-di-GMP-specific phosphodiesterase class I)|nr:EAL domain-containing protein [Alphaproteobacteria bacterium]MCB1551196.1 EAL domain-containing protein [Alphaproteobacteria bacterium]MCB9985920.1 EAL domain-containing protein [Micavibrio sp.]HPQ50989.1 EAL domain-containing protein [Alphaproteobacteria bacterium]HRK96926.1 EAL domain-containing protein [Alphaproteobacteria bacterium]